MRWILEVFFYFHMKVHPFLNEKIYSNTDFLSSNTIILTMSLVSGFMTLKEYLKCWFLFFGFIQSYDTTLLSSPGNKVNQCCLFAV